MLSEKVIKSLCKILILNPFITLKEAYSNVKLKNKPEVSVKTLASAVYKAGFRCRKPAKNLSLMKGMQPNESFWPKIF